MTTEHDGREQHRTYRGREDVAADRVRAEPVPVEQRVVPDTGLARGLAERGARPDQAERREEDHRADPDESPPAPQSAARPEWAHFGWRRAAVDAQHGQVR